MSKLKRLAALTIALVLMFTAAQAEWKAGKGNNRRFLELLQLLADAVDEGGEPDMSAVNGVLAEIRERSGDDYDIARAIVDHWNETVVDRSYRMFAYRGQGTAYALEQSGLDFSGKHAFIVLGYRLENGEMAEELKGRCDAAAAAAVSFPDAILITTGGATGSNNPQRHTEAGEMKKYMTEQWGIDGDRIFTETKAKTTLENAENTFRILEENGIETYTIVTSNYHQRWSQILFNAMAAIYEKETGYRVRMVGNFNYLADPSAPVMSHVRTGLQQLASMFRK